MQIKNFATKYKLTTDTVRYYEKEGLLEPLRQNNSYRSYDAQCEKAIKYILVLKQLGFSLREIKMLLMLEEKPISSECNEESAALFKDKISSLQRKIEFYIAATEALQTAYKVIEKGSIAENKDEIESLVEEMYRRMEKEVRKNATS